MSQSDMTALKAWDRIQELSNIVESYLRVKQVQKKIFSDFLQRLTKTVKIGVTDPEAGHIVIESLAYKNVNLECKMIIGPLKIR